MRIPKSCDVVVIGGGPAGSSAATLLSQKGYDVVLFDKEKHPRYRVGESIIPHFWRYCDLVGASDQMEAEGFVHKAGGTVAWEGTIRQVALRDFGHVRPALHVERDRFDQILLESSRAHGTQVFEEVGVLRACLDEAKGISVTYRAADEDVSGQIGCRFVVDASGQNAVIARQLGIRVIDEDIRFMSIWGYFDDSMYVGGDGRAHPFENVRTIAPTTFVASLGGWGWAWHIPLRKTTSVGLVIPIEMMRAVKNTERGLEDYFLRTCHTVPHLSRLLENARYCESSLRVIRDYSYRPTQLAGPGFFLIGDAAAFVDPIFSVGVVIGMYSAYIAAWAVDRALQHRSRTDESQAIFASQLGGRLEVARALALPCYNGDQVVSDQAKSYVQSESALEQELLCVVSSLTTRSQNYLNLATDKDGRAVTSDRFRVLESIAF